MRFVKVPHIAICLYRLGCVVSGVMWVAPCWYLPQTIYLSWMVYPTMNASAKVDHVLNIRITHKTARVPLMEAVAFKDKTQALTELRTIEDVEECLYLQTCNRIELYLVAEEADKTVNLAKNFLANRADE